MTKLINDKLYLEGKEISDNSQLVDLYKQRIAKFGMNGETMFYLDDAQHQAKVAQIAVILRKFVQKNDKVLDIGCGYGSLVPLLPECQYTGIDLVPDFISFARSKYPIIDFRIISLDECQDTYDWCVLLGVVNGIADPDVLVELAWDKCKDGVIVDFIDRRKFPEDDNELNRFDMGTCLAKFLEMGARTVEVYPTDYPWTVFVVRKIGEFIRAL